MSTLPRRLNLLFSIGLALVSIIGVWFGARSVAGATDVAPISRTTAPSSAAPNEASLHNPTLDNHDWYEFNSRYQSVYPFGAWLPDDDDNVYDNKPRSTLQDWRLWFQDGTTVIDTDPEQVYAHFDEGIQMRPYEWGKQFDQVAGLYQVVYNTTPCFVYEFQMYGQSRPEDPNDYREAVLKVGIDQVGWHPDSANDPAVHPSVYPPDGFPSTTVWGPSHDYKFAYAPLTVTAEALNTKIVVFTYGDAPGGRYHRVLWDTGSFRDVTPERIYDPEDQSTPSGIYNLGISVGSDLAIINWTTVSSALGQVYYRLRSAEPVSPTGTMLFSVYLPLVTAAPAPWQATALNKTPTTAHTATLTDLLPGRSYEYIVVSRGLGANNQCTTWVSQKRTFTTNP
jgi:hypothetical protein